MIDVEVRGLIDLQRKTEQMIADLHGAPILNAMRDSTLLVQRKAKQNSPVDTGRLRASITPEIRGSPVVGGLGTIIVGVVGSNVVYAPYQELGTRRGIKPKRYLERAFLDSEAAINRRFEKAVHEVVEK